MSVWFYFPFFLYFHLFLSPSLFFVTLHLIFFFFSFNWILSSPWTGSLPFLPPHTPSVPSSNGDPLLPNPPPRFCFLIFPSSHSGTLRPQPSGTALEHAGTLIKTGPPGACKLAAGVNRKQSQSNRKSLLSDSGPSLPGFLSGSRQWAREGGQMERKGEKRDLKHSPPPNDTVSGLSAAAWKRLNHDFGFFVLFFNHRLLICCCSWWGYRQVGKKRPPSCPPHCSPCVYICNRGVVMISEQDFPFFCVCIVSLLFLLLLLMIIGMIILRLGSNFLLFVRAHLLWWRQYTCTEISNYLLCNMRLRVSTLPPAGKILFLTVLIGSLFFCLFLFCFFIFWEVGNFLL